MLSAPLPPLSATGPARPLPASVRAALEHTQARLEDVRTALASDGRATRSVLLKLPAGLREHRLYQLEGVLTDAQRGLRGIQGSLTTLRAQRLELSAHLLLRLLHNVRLETELLDLRRQSALRRLSPEASAQPAPTASW